MAELISNTTLGATAHWTAAARALENERPDRLFSDPWAQALAGDIGTAWMAGRPPESLLPIVLRTRYFDDRLLEAVQEHGLRQVVLAAAGLDTRAYRLVWPAGVRLFELDQAEVLLCKQLALAGAGAQPACERITAAADLAGSWRQALVEAGFNPAQPAAWLLEGFLFYLSSEQLVCVLEEVTALAAPGSWLGFDIINSAMLTSPLTQKWVEMQAAAGAPWKGALDDPVGFLSERGWAARLTQAGAPDANHGRWRLPVIPVEAPGFPHNWYVTAQRLA